MDTQIIDDAAIRAYLLGRIGAEEELSAQFDERMLADPEFSLRMDLVEDEILEDYADGLLTAADVEAVESHFLVPPERQRKLRGMLLICHRLKGVSAAKSIGTNAEWARADAPVRGRVLVLSSARTWAEIAAGIVLVAGTVYFWYQQRELRHAVEQSKQELAQWKQLQAAGSAATSLADVVTLNLLVPGLSRGDQALPEAHLSAGAGTLHILVALTAQPAGLLEVRLEQGGAVNWSQGGLPARKVAGGAVLTVDLPVSVVPEGTCKLIVTGLGRGEIAYWFKATRSQ